MQISLQKAKRLALYGQLLDGRHKSSKGKEEVARIIQHLGYVQIDSISVIERSHHHTLWVRFSGYSPAMLHDLQKERRIFEYWGHAASYLPMEDYRYYLPRMRLFNNPESKWLKNNLQKHGHLMPKILERIRKEGALSSKDFTAENKRGNWWDWKPAKVALELLFWQGKLMIEQRHNFQRVYNLTERVLPKNVENSYPTAEESARFFICRALQSYGLASQKEICEHIHTKNNANIIRGIKKLVDTGEITPLQVKGLPQEYYALPNVLERVSKFRKKSPQIFILSPFDNFIIQRKRIQDLFQFNYVLECYVPAIKRQYGYFTLAVLWGEKFVCRIDTKANRKQKTLLVQNLVFEKEFREWGPFLPALCDKLKELAKFNQCETITVMKTQPARIKSHLVFGTNSKN